FFSENLTPSVIRRISKEIADLVTNPPEGIKVLANEEDFTDIQAIIEGPAGTPYHQGSFRIKLVLGKTFPTSPPKGFFLTKIFHPNVSRNGEICVNTLKKDWNENLGIKHILLIIKCLLIVPNPESALNEDAAKLLLENYDEYFKRAKMITEIHAKTSIEKENVCNESENNSNANNDPSSRKISTTNDMMPLSKKLASNNSMNQSRNLIKPLNKDKKRTLKRL
ncbi:Ubiquitin-conjugating enzyme E2 S, partial [Sarcoptes scabiei]